jgi:hypothetical protein
MSKRLLMAMAELNWEVSKMKKILTFVAVLFSALAIFPAVSFSATTTVTLGWTSNTEADLNGYRVYHATTSAGPWALVQSANKTATTMILPGIVDGPHCWRLTSFDLTNLESAPTSAACLQADTQAPATPTGFGIVNTVVVP